MEFRFVNCSLLLELILIQHCYNIRITWNFTSHSFRMFYFELKTEVQLEWANVQKMGQNYRKKKETTFLFENPH